MILGNNGTSTCPTPIVKEYQVTHFQFLDTDEMEDVRCMM